MKLHQSEVQSLDEHLCSQFERGKMALFLTTKFSKATLLFASGTLADYYTTEQISAVLIQNSSNSLELWKTYQKKSSILLKSTVFVSLAASINCLLLEKLKDLRFGLCGALNVAIILWNLKFSRPIRKKIEALEEDSDKAKRIIDNWRQVELGSAVLGISSLCFCIYTVVWKKHYWKL